MKNILKSLIFSLVIVLGEQSQAQGVPPVIHSVWTTNQTPYQGFDFTSTAIGTSATASQFGTSYGFSAISTGSGTAVGIVSSANNAGVAFGYGATAGTGLIPGQTNIAIGDGAVVNGNNPGGVTNTAEFFRGTAANENTVHFWGQPALTLNANKTISMFPTFGAVIPPPNTITLASSSTRFTNFYMAYNSAIDGDTMYVAPGTYIEGNHVCNPVNNLTVVPLGVANIIISLTNALSVVDAPHIYIKPGNNLHIYPGLVISETTSNQFNAIFGTPTNQATATNWFVDGLIARHCDSDGFYWSHSNSITLQGTTRFCRIQGYWDTEATAGVAQNKNLFSTNNTTVVHEDFNFDCNFVNGFTPAVRRGININAGNFIYRRGSVTMTLATGKNFGSQSTGTNVAVTLQGVKFNVSGPNYEDLDVNGQSFSADSSTANVNSGTLTIVSGNFPPNVVSFQNIFGSPSMPTPLSNASLEGQYDYWTFSDIGDSGAMYASNTVTANSSLQDGTLPFCWYQGGYTSNGGLHGDRNVNDKAGIWVNFIAGDGHGLTNVDITSQQSKTPRAVTVTASPFTFANNTPNVLECYVVAGGTVSFSLAKNGVTIKSGLTGDGYYLLQPTNKVTVTYTVAPTMFTNAF